MYQIKTFFGTIGRPADTPANSWLRKNPDIEIVDFRYLQSRMGDHSIAILYRDSKGENDV